MGRGCVPELIGRCSRELLISHVNLTVVMLYCISNGTECRHAQF